MRKLKREILFLFFLSGCIYDPIVENFTIVNKSENPIVFALTEDTLFGNKIYEYSKLSSYEADIKKDFVVFPGEEGYLISNRSWDYLVDKDTNVLYLYIIDIKKLDSLKKIESDTNMIKQTCLTIQKYTYKKLQKLNWRVVYYGK